METDPGVPEARAVPAELKEGLPRRARLSGNGITTAGFAAVLLLFAAVSSFEAGIHVVRFRRQEAELGRSGSEMAAEVQRVRFEGQVPWVHYDFAVNGATFKGEARVPKQLLQEVKSSYTLPVRYLPGNPAVNHPAGWKGLPRWHWQVFVLPIILAAAFGVVMLILLRAQRELIMKGSPALAEVSKCSRSRNSFLVKYEFRTGQGIVTQGAGWCKDQQETGSNIWIVYLPRNPQVSRPYPILNFRLAPQ